MLASSHRIECGGAAAASAKTAAAAAAVSTLLLMFCVSENFVSKISEQPQRSDVDVRYEICLLNYTSLTVLLQFVINK